MTAPRLLFITCLWGGLLGASHLPPAPQLEVERLISTEMSRANIPGLSVALAAGGELVFTGGFGLSDVENYVPAKAHTVYRTASIAKVMTAVGIMQLVEAGKISLDAPIQRYVPAFPTKPWPITVRQLLNHQSGIRHYRYQEEIDSTRHFPDLFTALRLFQNDPLVGEPGTLVRYTTYGYVLLGAAMELITGQRYLEYLRQRILAPAGMERTRQDHLFSLVPNRARGYMLTRAGVLQNCALADTSNKVPGGGLLSTPEDLVRFSLAFRRGALLRTGYVDMMMLPSKLKDGRPTAMGLGWKLTTVDGRKAIWHDGGQQGVSTILMLLPKEGVSVALMCNLERAALRDLASRIANLLVGVVPQHDTSAAR